MDVDPKPSEDEEPSIDPAGLEEPESPEPTTPSNDSLMDSPQPTGEPSPVIAAALDQNAAEDTEPSTESPVMSSPTPVVKKSRKSMVITIAVIVVLLIIGALAWYVLYGVPASTPTASDTTKVTSKTTTPATAATNDETINNAVDGLTSNATDEATLTGTDDSSNATDASTSAANVGESVNENNF